MKSEAAASSGRSEQKPDIPRPTIFVGGRGLALGPSWPQWLPHSPDSLPPAPL